MTMFADARHDCAYNTDFLNKPDMEFIKGFDYGLEVVLNFIKYNLDVHAEELNDTGNGRIADDEVFSNRSDLYEILEENKDIITECIAQWHESERDMLVTSLIDNMDGKEYEILRGEAIAKNGKEKYYDTRKYACTGEKEFVD